MRIEVNGKDINSHHPDPDPEMVSFLHVQVNISGAKDAVEAYDLLCAALASIENERVSVEWETDVYTTVTNNVETDPAPTSELFPESRRRDG
jgi:hypothetical protein